MIAQEIKKILLSHALFAHVSAAQLSQLADGCAAVHFIPGEILLHQDATVAKMFLIVEGLVQVYRLDSHEKKIHLTILSNAQILGELALIDSAPSCVSVRAIKPTDVIEIPGESFRSLLNENLSASHQLNHILVHRLRTIDQKIERMQTDSLEERALSTILELGQYFPEGVIPLTHEELAEIIGGSRARVSEALEHFVKQGLLIQRNRRLIVNTSQFPPKNI